jgi:hypothetical protein
MHAEEGLLTVVAFSSPRRPAWHWRILDYGGATVEESTEGFATIAQALAEGTERLRSHVDRDRPVLARSLGPISWSRR